MFTIGAFTSEDNPPGAIAKTTGSVGRKPSKPGIDTWTVFTLQSDTPGRGAGRLRATLVIVARVAADCLTAVPRRFGGRLFAMNDTEAYWRGWQITKLHGGLTRRYRDPAFDTLTAAGPSGRLDEAG